MYTAQQSVTLYGDHADCRVVLDSVLPPIGRLFVRFEFGYQWWHVRPFEGDVRTLQHAIIERCLVVKRAGVFASRPACIDRKAYVRALAAFKQVAGHSSPLTAHEFAMSRPGRKKRVYLELAKDFDLTLYDFTREATTSAFVKCEKTQQRTEKPPNRDTGYDKDPVPRCINTRGPPFHMLYGRYTVPTEKMLYSEWNTVFGHTAMFKCMTYSERAENLLVHWEHVSQYGQPVCVSLDYSRMDQHQGEAALKFGHACNACHYDTIHQPVLDRVLRLQLRNVARARCKDGSIKAKLGAMRMSGDMDTSSGNNSIAAGNMYEFLLDNGCSLEWTRVAIDGDDNLIILPSQFLDRLVSISDWYLRRGFTLTLEEPVYIFEQIEFCQMHPVFLGHKWMMVRDPNKVLNSDLSGYANCLRLRYARELYHAIGIGGLSISAGIPILQEFYLMAQRIGLKGRSLGQFADVAHFGWARIAHMEGLYGKAIPVSDDARMSFWKAFNIAPSDQLAIEADLRTITLGDELEWALAHTTKIHYPIINTKY